jgi:hypothetical protein
VEQERDQNRPCALEGSSKAKIRRGEVHDRVLSARKRVGARACGLIHEASVGTRGMVPEHADRTVMESRSGRDSSQYRMLFAVAIPKKEWVMSGNKVSTLSITSGPTTTGRRTPFETAFGIRMP